MLLLFHNISLYSTTDIDECYNDPCDEMYTCYNVNGGYFCACNDGSGEGGGSGSYCEGEYMFTCAYRVNKTTFATISGTFHPNIH